MRAAVTKSLDKAVAKAKMTEDVRNEVLGRITGATQREALADVDLVVEAIVEDLGVKLDLFRDLDRICKPVPFWPRPLRRCPSWRWPRSPPAPGRSRDALLQPGADHEAGRSGEPVDDWQRM